MSLVKTYKTELKYVLNSLLICMFCPNSGFRIAVSQLSKEALIKSALP